MHSDTSDRDAKDSQNAVGSPYVLEGKRLSKRYGGVVALDGVNLKIRAGELLGLIGDNGAGKSTLAGILCGAIKPDEGDILHRGERIEFNGPLDARIRGIETVYQDLALARVLDVTANLFLGRELVYPVPLGPLRFRRDRAMAREATARLLELEIVLPAVRGKAVERLSGGQRQAVAIARAAAWATDVLFMDEPTAALGVRQSAAVLNLARRLVERGTGVVLITHTLPYVMEFADRVVVLRHGRKVADLNKGQATAEGLVSLITGLDPGGEPIAAHGPREADNKSSGSPGDLG
jgi:fructose transport system ATP-binding protein